MFSTAGAEGTAEGAEFVVACTCCAWALWAFVLPEQAASAMETHMRTERQRDTLMLDSEV